MDRLRAWLGWLRRAAWDGRAALDTPVVRRLKRYACGAVTLGVGAYLVYQVTHIGGRAVVEALPTTPWFYVLFGALYLMLPLVQTAVFRWIWGTPWAATFGAVLKKRVYNKDVLDYAGEAYLYTWARRHAAATPRAVAHAIKDNAILSGAASLLVALALLAALVGGGLVDLAALGVTAPDGAALGVMAPDGAASDGTTGGGLYLVLGAAGLLAGGVLVYRFRARVFALPTRQLAGILALHVARNVAAPALQVLQWAVVLPDVPLAAWATLLAVQVVALRLPILPSRDLLFLTAGLKLAGPLALDPAALAGLLGVHSLLDKGANLALFTAVTVQERRRLAPAPTPDRAAEPSAQPAGQASGMGNA